MVYYGHIHAYPIITLPEVDGILLSLNDGDPNDSTIITPRDFRAHDVRSAIDFHRILNHGERDVHPNYLVILDTQDLSERGVFVVKISYHGTIDAVRMPAVEAGMSVCSLSIDNTTWQETRESYNEQDPPLTTGRQFLVYGLNLDSNELKKSCQLLNDGLGALNAQSGGFAEYRSIYVKSLLEFDLEEIQARHCQVAKATGCHESMFAVVECNYSEEGVLLVKLDEVCNGGHIQKKLPIANEVLNWVHLGLWTWLEAAEV